MCAIHVWPGQKHQRSHARNKRIISRRCYDLAVLRTVVCQIQRWPPVSSEPHVHRTPSNPGSAIFEGCCISWFGRHIASERSASRGAGFLSNSPVTTRSREWSHDNQCSPCAIDFFDSILTEKNEIWIAFENTSRGLHWLDWDQLPQGTPKLGL